MNKKNSRIISVFFITSILIFLVTGGVVISFSQKIIRKNQEISYVGRLYEIFEEIRITLRSTIISQRNYIITNNKEHYQEYNVNKKHLKDELKKLNRIESKGFINVRELEQLDSMIDSKLRTLDFMIEYKNQDKAAPMDQMIEEKSNPIFENIQKIASNIENSLERIISEFRDSSQKDAKITTISIYSGYSIAFVLLFISFFSLQTQIKQRRQAEHELVLKSATLAETNVEKDKFYSILAHDLKNPLGALAGLTEFLDEAIAIKDIEHIREISTMIKKASQKTYYLLENLLDWAMIQTGRLTPSFAIFDVFKMIEDTYELVYPQIVQKKLNVTLPKNVFAVVYADENMVKTAFRNILSNAVKFTPENGQIIIDLKTEVNNVIITITDTGCGMKQEEIPLLFRIDKDNRLIGDGYNKGTGLGLILTKELMKRNNGDIHVESEYGKGSTFMLVVPKANAT